MGDKKVQKGDLNKMPETQRIYGYTRASTDEQRVDRGIAAIEKFCESQNMQLQEIVTDKVTGKNYERDGWKRLKRDLLRPGDTLIIPELDRLARFRNLIKDELVELKEMNVRVMALNVPTSLYVYQGDDKIAKMFSEMIENMMIEMYATFAESEMLTREKRQKEGITQRAIKAKKGEEKWNFGRRPVCTEEDFRREYEKVEAGEIKPKEAMENLGLKRDTYYTYRTRVIKNLPFSTHNYEKWIENTENKDEKEE